MQKGRISAISRAVDAADPRESPEPWHMARVDANASYLDTDMPDRIEIEPD